MKDLNELLPFLVDNARSIKFIAGFDPEKSSVSTATVGDSIFKGIDKAKASRPLDHISMGLVAVEVESREYDTQRFTDTSIEGAARKAMDWVQEKLADEGR